MSDNRRVFSSARLANVGAWGALISAVGASLYLAVAPAYASASVSASVGSGSSAPQSAPVQQLEPSLTLAAVNGPIVFVWFGVTVFLAALPLLFRRTRFARPAVAIGAGLLLAFVILGSASIGGAYLPAAAFALLAAALTPPSRPAT